MTDMVDSPSSISVDPANADDSCCVLHVAKSICVDPQHACSSPASLDHCVHAPVDLLVRRTCAAVASLPDSLSDVPSCQNGAPKSGSFPNGRFKPRPQCVDLARVFFEGLHARVPQPFQLPAWVQSYSSFITVVEETKRKARDGQLTTGSEAILFAVSECFMSLDAQCNSCCDLALIKIMLCLPVTTNFRRRTKDVLLDLLINISSQHTVLTLVPNSVGEGLLDGLTFLLQAFFTSQLSIAGSPEAQQWLSQYHVRHVPPYLEECHEAVLCLQILINIARQRRNHGILLRHSRLLSLTSMAASYPLISEQILTLALRFVSLVDGYIPAIDTIFPNNAVVESVITIMEHYARVNFTSLICPFYLPSGQNVAFLSDILCIILALVNGFDRGSPRDYSTAVARLLSVVTHVLLSVDADSGGQGKQAARSVFDVDRMLQIGLSLVVQCADAVVCDGKFVLALVRLARHELHGRLARFCLRAFCRMHPSFAFSANLTCLLEDTAGMDCDPHEQTV